MDVTLIGGALTALALLATTISTFFSRRQERLKADYADALAELAKVNADLDESDRRNYQYRRALIRNGIPVPGEDDDDGPDPLPTRSRGARRRPGPRLQSADSATDPAGRYGRHGT